MKLTPENTNLFFDLDGTLIVNGEANEETIKAVIYAKAKGCKIYLNTGRARGNLLKSIDKLSGIPFDGFLCAGCSIYTGTGCENAILETTLKSEEVDKLVRYGCDKSYWFTVETIDNIFIGKIHGEITYTKKQLDAFYLDMMQQLSNEKVVKISYFPPKGTKDDNISKIFNQYDWVVYPHCYELYHKGKNKGSILEIFRNTFKIKDGVFVAFGDSENDLDFFKQADVSVAMRHAPDLLKNLATFTATTPNGVAELIYKLI